MAEIAIAGIVVPTVVSAVAPVFVEFVKKKMDERKNSSADIHEVLRKGLDELLDLQNVKEREVLINSKDKDPSELYKNWNESISEIQKEVTRLNIEYYQGKEDKMRFLKNSWRQVKVEIKRALKEVFELLGNCPKEVLVYRQVIQEIKVPQIVKYPTLRNALDDIQTLLKIEGLKCVALYGQRGVGKTTIMKHLNNYYFNHNCADKKFDMIILIFVEASAQIDAQTEESHILQKIAERIMVVGEGDELAREIHRVLENKIYLLILDGIRYADALNRIWENLGISSHRSDSKVVISTHYCLVLRSNYVDFPVDLKMLSPDEEWEMFRNLVGPNNVKHIPNAQLICKRCCFCLPSLIGAIAKSFTDEDPIDWGTNLDEWIYWPDYRDHGSNELYSVLKICYDRLRDHPGEQNIFLYAALYPANSKIYTDYFVECCIAQGFLGDVRAATNYRKLRSRGINETLQHLVNVAFLEGSEEAFLEGSEEEMRFVKMNDFYRQLALHISSKESRPECKIYVDNEPAKAFRSASWEHARWVSMVDSKRDSLPANPNFVNLQTLLLQKSLVEIPTPYFLTMGNLLVLNLNGTIISSLPSLAGLTSLKVFYLKSCSNLIIDSGDEIQRLTILRVFDSRGTKVKFVPYLKNLSCLKISYSPKGNHNEISRLQNLQELIIEVERQFKLQWINVARHIGEITGSRNIKFIWKYV